jgi:hypothetical protein
MNKYQVHMKRLWPYDISYHQAYSLDVALKFAIKTKQRYVSKNGKIIWENLYYREEKKVNGR